MILHVFNSSLVSGPETLVLPALARSGLPVRIVLLREKRVEAAKVASVERYLEQLGLSFTTIDVRSRRDRIAQAELAAVLREPGLEVAHAHDVKASYVLLRAAALVPDRAFSLVTTHHGVKARSGWLVRMYELFYSFVLVPHFDRVFCVCSRDEQRLLARGISRAKVRLHLNGVTRESVDSASRELRQAELRRRWGVTGDAPLLGVAARLAAEKRHSFLLRVLREVKARGQEFQVLCFGVGPLAESLHREARELGLEGEVRWMGYRAGLGEEMAGFDAVLSFSRAEGLPINLIEAGWAATPVCASGVDGVVDLIPRPDLGCVIPAGAGVKEAADLLVGFLADPVAMRHMGERFQRHVQREFSGEAWLKRLVELYAELGAESIGRQSPRNEPVKETFA